MARERFVICNLKAAPSPGDRPALSSPVSSRDRSHRWRCEDALVVLLPGDVAGRGGPGSPPAPGGLLGVPWERWANHSCFHARRRERKQSLEAFCSFLQVLIGMVPRGVWQKGEQMLTQHLISRDASGMFLTGPTSSQTPRQDQRQALWPSYNRSYLVC